MDKEMKRRKHKIAPRYVFDKTSDDHQMKCFRHRLDAHQRVCVVLLTKQEVGKIRNTVLLQLYCGNVQTEYKQNNKLMERATD